MIFQAVELRNPFIYLAIQAGISSSAEYLLDDPRYSATKDEILSISIAALDNRLSEGMQYLCGSIEEAIEAGRFFERKLGQYAILNKRHEEASRDSMPWSSPFDIETNIVEFLVGFPYDVVVQAINTFDLRVFKTITASNIIESDEACQEIEHDWTQLKDAVTTCALSDTRFIQKAMECAEVRLKPSLFEKCTTDFRRVFTKTAIFIR